MALEQLEINICGKVHKLQVESSKVELYRLAERSANNAIVKLERMANGGMNPKDAAGLAAFQFAVTNINLRQQSEIDSAEEAAIKALDARLEEYMNDLSVEKKI